MLATRACPGVYPTKLRIQIVLDCSEGYFAFDRDYDMKLPNFAGWVCLYKLQNRHYFRPTGFFGQIAVTLILIYHSMA